MAILDLSKAISRKRCKIGGKLLLITRVVIDIFQKVSPIFDIDAGNKSIVDTDIDTLP